MVGRDIGTVVLPDAEVKVFLTASPETRARRRYGEVIGRGEEGDYAVLLQQILRRDDLDASRAASPMRPADDARVIDTDGLSLEQVVDTVAEMVGAPSR
jgi:cytidylate kinase